jgi:hypothetical protein
MSRRSCFVLVIAVMFFLIVAAPAMNGAPIDDACTLLTTAQISNATTMEFGDGTYVTPTFKKTCTWTIKKPAGKTARIVTLYLQGVDAHEAGKKQMVGAVNVIPASGVGDDAYYLAVGPQVYLFVKKGTAAFKMSVYGDMPLETKEAMEKTLAQQVVSHL